MNPNQPPPPPKWLDKLLNWFVAPHLREEVLGDIHERYYQRVQRLGEGKARWLYWCEVLAYVRPEFIKREPSGTPDRQYPNPTNTDMLRNYLKIAWRNLIKNKAFSAINIGGLAVGMAVAMLIGLWIYDELSFNKYHQNYDRIAQVIKGTENDGKQYSGQTYLPLPLIKELEANYRRNFKHIVPAAPSQDRILSAGENKVSRAGQSMGADAPEMLGLKMRQGTWACLKDPYSIALSESTAKALFGEKDPMNQLVKINNKLDVKVTGVYEDLPHNSQFHEVKFFTPWDLYVANNKWINEQGWDNHFLFLYAQLQDNVEFSQVSANIKDAEMRVIKNLEGLQQEAAFNPRVLLHPMRDWHFYSDFKDGVADRGPVQFVWLVGIIGAFVLLLACINFMNLSTARSEKRAKEVGVRKAIGSMRRQLISQFFSESFLIVLFAFALALLLVTLSLPWFNEIAAKAMTMLWTNAYFWLASFAFSLLTGVLAGSYPALYLSSFQPVKVLKGTIRIGRFAAIPRKVLVVLQFTVSIALIISTIIVYNQILFAKNRPVGYNRDGLIMVHKKSEDFYGKYDVLRNELKNTGVVADMAESGGRVTDIWSGNGGFSWQGKDPAMEAHFATLSVSADYAKTVGWQFVDGRNFVRGSASDSSGFILNEAAVKYMGLKNPVGQQVRWTNKWYGVDQDYRILGVVKDMVMGSPFEPIKPTVFFLQGQQLFINIKINPQVSAAEALPKIEAVFKKLIPSAPFDYTFVDQEYAAKFAAEERIGTLAGLFASLAIFISCLGLFGLASFTAEQRTKEIGIRKVLGASVTNLWQLLSKDFVVLVIIACLIAIPIAYYFMSGWLQHYAYRTELSWWIFAVTIVGALAITLLTVSFQAIKAALMNPVKTLRTE